MEREERRVVREEDMLISVFDGENVCRLFVDALFIGEATEIVVYRSALLIGGVLL